MLIKIPNNVHVQQQKTAVTHKVKKKKLCQQNLQQRECKMQGAQKTNCLGDFES